MYICTVYIIMDMEPLPAGTISLPFTNVVTAVSQTALPSQHAAGSSGEQAAAVSQPQSVFSSTMVNIPSSAVSLGNLTTYNEVVNKLNHLFDTQMCDIEQLTDEHWKSQEFPLARIKKIMRMDEEVKMISGEVPIMFSKAVEMFISELTLRAWLHTEEAKRRTVQRSDVAMAITKHDMFDFLIDIVPREEIQMKAKSGHKAGESEHVQLLPPELLQLYLQLAQSQSVEGGAEDEQGPGGSSTAMSGLIQQQLQLLQQLVQIQQMQQAQEMEEQQPPTLSMGQTIQLQHPHSHQLHPSTPGISVSGTAGLSEQSQGMAVNLSGGQQTLCHVNPPPPLHAVTLQEGDPSSMLEAQRQYQLQHMGQQQPMQVPHSQTVVGQVLAEHFPTEQISEHFSPHPPPTAVQEGSGGVEFQHIPESESISRSISPITATLQSAGEEIVAAYTHGPHHPRDALQMNRGGSGETDSQMSSIHTSMPST